MSKLTVSVAMATYNGALYLREQLDSFVKQTRLPDELVVTDDGSTDNTLAVLEAFQSTAPFEVKIFRNSARLGYTKNFEKALSLCSGDVIFMSDQDDVWFPGKIERVVSCLDSNPGMTVAVNDEILTNETLSYNGGAALQNMRSVGGQESGFFPGCCTAIRRKWRDATLPVPADHFTYDRWINTVADLLGARTVMAEPLQYSRRHASNTSTLSLGRPRRASLFETSRALGLRDSRPGWLEERDRKAALLQWMKEREDLLRSFRMEEARERACKQLELEIQAFEGRIALMNLPRGFRAPAVAKFLMEGGYTHFSGWKSAINDVLR